MNPSPIMPRGARRPRAFNVGDVAGVFEVLDPGDPSAYSARRRVSVRCTKCRYRNEVYECWLRWLKSGRVPSSGTCSMCTFGTLKGKKS